MRSRTTKPKILYICTAAPYGEVYGMGLRTRNIGLLLKELGELTTVAITPNQWSEAGLEGARQHLNLDRFIRPQKHRVSLANRIRREFDPKILDTHSTCITPEESEYLKRMISEHDVVWTHLLRTANFTGIYNWPKAVLDVDDFPSNFHLTVARETNSIKEKLDRYRRHLMWKRREQRIKERFASIVVCKDSDRNAFKVPERTFAVANGFDRKPTDRPSPEALAADAKFGIIGNFNYRLNTNATEWFLEQVWHKIRAIHPQAQLRLVGRGGEKYDDPQNGICGLGFVDDPTAELSRWSALLAPTRMGGGTSVKIAEAFARKIPVIATAHGARGYDVEPGQGILVADDPQDYANACLQLLEQPQIGADVAAVAYEYFEKHLVWEAMMPSVSDALEAALQQNGEATAEMIA